MKPFHNLYQYKIDFLLFWTEGRHPISQKCFFRKVVFPSFKNYLFLFILLNTFYHENNQIIINMDFLWSILFALHLNCCCLNHLFQIFSGSLKNIYPSILWVIIIISLFLILLKFFSYLLYFLYKEYIFNNNNKYIPDFWVFNFI